MQTILRNYDSGLLKLTRRAFVNGISH